MYAREGQLCQDYESSVPGSLSEKWGARRASAPGFSEISGSERTGESRFYENPSAPMFRGCAFGAQPSRFDFADSRDTGGMRQKYGSQEDLIARYAHLLQESRFPENTAGRPIVMVLARCCPQ